MTNRRIRVLYCTGDFEIGGTQGYLLNLVRGLDRRRFDISVVCLAERGALSEAMRATGVPIESLEMDRPLWHPAGLRAIASLSNRIRGRFDIVHTLLGHANVVGLAAATLAGHRRVLASQRSLHPTSGSFRRASPALVAVARLLFKHVARRVVVNNPAIVDALRSEGLRADQIVLISNGIDTERFRPAVDRRALRRIEAVDPDVPLIGFVGRMISEKGMGRLIEAATKLDRVFPTLRLLAVGDGPERLAFQEAVECGALRGRVDFLGVRHDTERLYPLFDAFAFPSTYSEGTPNTVLEAMACGVPPVVLRMAQTETLIRDGDTGILVGRDDDAALARALERILKDAEGAAKIGRQAREFVCVHHSLRAMIESTERLYEDEMAR